jgi:hypothetical protein
VVSKLKLLAIAFLMVGFSACSEKDKDDPKKESDLVGLGVIARDMSRSIQVTDLKGRPIAGAEVLIGLGVNQPFADNFVTTDVNGVFVAPSDWNSAQPITISAKGFIRTTYFGQVARGQALKMKPQPLATPYELTGVATGFNIKNSDKNMDFALMIPGIRKEELLAFNIDMFVSPKTDEVTVYGQMIQLPSNTSIPKQKENYGIFPVTLEKPLYRMYFQETGLQRVSAILGSFPFNKTVSEMQKGASFIDLINNFSVKGGSVREVNVSAPTQSFDIPVTDMIFNQTRTFKSPAFSDEEVLIAVSLNPNGNEFYPTDFKNVLPSTAQSLVTTATNDQQLLVALKKKSEDMLVSGAKISAALIPFEVDVEPTLLPMIENPQVVNLYELKVQLPQVPAGLVENGAAFILSTVVKTGTGKDYKEVSTRHWEVYSDQWMNSVNLPRWPNDIEPTGIKRWEVLLMSADSARAQNAVDLTSRVFETVTHATHSATDF